jgi:hypothetical protein
MAPITLTKSQFQSKRPGGDYSKYLGFINKRRTAQLGAVNADPLAPTPAGDINAIVNRFAGMYGAPMSDARIQSDAKAQLDPIVAAITGSIGDRAKTSTSAIAANSAALAKDLGSIDYAAPYRTAEVDQANVDAALREALASRGGTDLAGDLSKRLSIIDDPAVASTASGIGDRGAALGTTELARGSANMGSLIAQAAAGKEYGLKQPGIARESGLQDIAGVNKTAVSEISDKTAQLLQQLPTIVANLRNSSDSRSQARAAAAAQLYETLTGQNITKATAKAGLANTNFDNGLAYASTFGVDPVTGEPVKGYHVDGNGNVVKNATPSKVAPGGRNGLTADQLAGMQHDAGKAAADLYHGVTKTVNGQQVVVSYTQTYPDAIKTLMQQYPKLGRAAILKLVNAWYKPGEYGRPGPTAPIGSKGAPGPVQGKDYRPPAGQ